MRGYVGGSLSDFCLVKRLEVDIMKWEMRGMNCVGEISLFLVNNDLVMKVLYMKMVCAAGIYYL